MLPEKLVGILYISPPKHPGRMEFLPGEGIWGKDNGFALETSS